MADKAAKYRTEIQQVREFQCFDSETSCLPSMQARVLPTSFPSRHFWLCSEPTWSSLLVQGRAPSTPKIQHASNGRGTGTRTRHSNQRVNCGYHTFKTRTGRSIFSIT